MTDRPKDTLHDFALQQACEKIERLNRQLVTATDRELMLRKDMDALRQERDDYMQKAIALLTGLEANPALIDQPYEFLVKLGMAIAERAKKAKENEDG